MSDLKREATLREISIKAVPVNDCDDLDLLLSAINSSIDEIDISKMVEKKAIADITDIILDDFEDLQKDLQKDLEKTMQEELEALRSQHQFESEYIEQLEQEITSINQDRDRQIAELKAQLEHYQQQPAPPPTDDRDLSDRLAIHVLQLEEEFKQRLATSLEIELQQITKQHLQEIHKRDALIERLDGKNNALELSQQKLTEELEYARKRLQDLSTSLEITQNKLLELTTQRDRLEEELSQHLDSQTQLPQSSQGLKNQYIGEYVGDLRRVEDLEQQIVDLQEQVLHQAAKSAEYEAAIQHWKEQSVRHQHHALQLSSALDRLLDEKPVKHLTQPKAQLNAQMSQVVHSREYLSERSPDSMPAPRPRAKVDLPFFLVKNR